MKKDCVGANKNMEGMGYRRGGNKTSDCVHKIRRISSKTMSGSFVSTQRNWCFVPVVVLSMTCALLIFSVQMAEARYPERKYNFKTQQLKKLLN